MELHGVTWVVKCCPTGSEARDPRKVLSSAINASTEGLMLKNLAAPYEFLGGGTGRKKAGKSRQNRPKPVKEGETPWRSNENQGISEEWSGHFEINPLKPFFLLSQIPCFSDQNMLNPMCPPWNHHFSSLNQVSGLNQSKTSFSSWKHYHFW